MRRPVVALTLCALVAAALIAPAVATAATTDPILIVDSYSVGDEAGQVEVDAGSRFDLSIVLENVRTRDADNVLVSLGNAAAVAAGDTQATGSSVPLAVLGTGSQKWVGSIDGEESESLAFSMIADPSATPGVYRLPVTISYESRNVPRSATHEIGIVVLGPISLEIAELEYPRELTEGDIFDIYAEVINAGDAPVSGVTLSLDAEAFDLDETEVLAGTLDADESDIIEATGPALEPGTHEVRILVGYRDSLGRTQEMSRAIEVEVIGVDEPLDEPAADETDDEPETFGEKIAAFFRGLFGLGG